MNWKHTFKHVDVSESLIQYTEECFQNEVRLLLKESQGQIFYSKGKRKECRVDVTVQNGNGHFKATALADSFYTAVDLVAEKLGKQFQKKKEKLQHHKDYTKSREARLKRLNPRLEYDNSPFPVKKPA
ncbi:MAG: ribosome-associated translation inhibitor RaiA [Pseudobdellovibrionaceae bacterium]